MSYSERRRGPRTRGGMQRGRMLDKISSRYARSDHNVFSCLRYIRGTGTGSESELLQSSDTNSENEQSNEPFVRVTRQQKKRKFNSSSGTGSKLMEVGSDAEVEVDYETLNNDEKINLILSKVSLNEKRLKRVESMCGSSMENSKRLSKVETVLNSHEDRVRLLEYKSIDLEARSRRNNILFYGFGESRNENCKSKIIEMVQEELEIDLNESDITRAHRLGRYDATKKRPVIVAFQSYTVTESIMKQGHRLKDSVYSISRDYPLEITRARQTLWPDYKQIKAQDPNAKVAIIYPAKLLVNGNVEKDLFPEWDTLMSGSRINLLHESQASHAKKVGILQKTQGPFGFGTTTSTSTPRHANQQGGGFSGGASNAFPADPSSAAGAGYVSSSGADSGQRPVRPSSPKSRSNSRTRSPPGDVQQSENNPPLPNSDA